MKTQLTNNIAQIINNAINEAFDFDNEITNDESLVNTNIIANQFFNQKYRYLNKLIKDKKWKALIYKEDYLIYYGIGSDNIFNHTLKNSMDAFAIYDFAQADVVYSIFEQAETKKIPQDIANIIINILDNENLQALAYSINYIIKRTSETIGVDFIRIFPSIAESNSNGSSPDLELFFIDLKKQQNNKPNISNTNYFKIIAQNRKSPLYLLRDCDFDIKNNNSVIVKNTTSAAEITVKSNIEKNKPSSHITQINEDLLFAICYQLCVNQVSNSIITTNLDASEGQSLNYIIKADDAEMPNIITKDKSNNFIINDKFEYIQINNNDNLIITLSNFKKLNNPPATINDGISYIKCFINYITYPPRTIISKDVLYITADINIEIGKKLIKAYKKALKNKEV